MADTRALATRMLPTNAAPYEIAGLSALLEVMPIDHAAASTIWNPWEAPSHLLPALAYALSVDLWSDDWDDLKKRSVIAASPRLHDLKTSIAGYREYLDIVDCTLIDYIAPPKDFILGETQSDDERRLWLRGLPELRLYTGVENGPWDGGLYFDAGFYDVHYLLPDRGRELSVRKAKLYDPVTDTETLIGPVDFDVIKDGDTTVSFERVTLPGPFDPEALYFDVDFFDVGFFVPNDPKAAPVFTLRADTAGQQGPFNPFDALPYGFVPVEAVPERVPLRRAMDIGLYLDASFFDIAFFGEDEAALGFYDAYKIARIGEKVGTPLLDAGSFFDLDYLGWPTHTLHLLVEADGVADDKSLFFDAGFFDVDYHVPDDLSRFDQALRAAYVASGPGSDEVTLSTETTRLLDLSDGIPLDGSFFFGQRVRRAAA